VKWIASMQQANKIVEMTDALIEMLFYAARSEDALVTVRQELDNLRNYMIIQKVRYYNRIRLEIQADEDTLDERIPKLILQPLVENAIFHGLAWKEESGTITINVERSGNDISITIQDNGVGMDDETLHSLTDSLAYAEKGEAQNIGLYNVMRRLKLHYGENHGFELKSKWGEGTTIRMVLPNLT
jgi:two-component system sensor histidine kinase YesM